MNEKKLTLPGAETFLAAKYQPILMPQETKKRSSVRYTPYLLASYLKEKEKCPSAKIIPRFINVSIGVLFLVDLY
ncbi:MAG: hypothetical protein WAT81_04675 [Candidatus Moraniibacteriota bacterium]